MALKKFAFILLNGSLFLETLVYGLLAPLVPYYAETFGANQVQLGLLFAVYSLSLLVASFPAGMACDKIGYRPVLLSGMMLLIISTLLLAVIQSFGLMLLARFLQGLAGAAIWTAALSAATALTPPEKRGGRLGLMMALTGLGTIAGPLFSGFLVQSRGYQAPFIYTALVLVLLTLPYLWLKLPGPGAGSQQENSSSGNYVRMLGNPRVLSVVLIIMAGSFSFGMLEPLLPMHLSLEFGMGSGEIGLVFGVLSLVFTISRPLTGYLSDRVGYKAMMLWGMGVTIVAMPALALSTGIILMYAAGCLYSLSNCAMMTPCLPLLTQYSDQEGHSSYGRSFGMVNAAYSVGLLLGPGLGGLVAEYFSFATATLFYSAMLLVLGIKIYSISGDTRSAA